MNDLGRTDPRFVCGILDWRWTSFLARLLVGAYILRGVVKLTDLPGAVAEQAHFGMPYPAAFAALTIAVELIGPALSILNRFVWLGAAASRNRAGGECVRVQSSMNRKSWRR